MPDHAPPTFNLLDEPWIEVVDDQARISEVSITELLEHADRYRALASDLETVNFAVLRVLLAILYRAWDSADYRDLDAALDHWEQRWTAGTLMDEAVRAYLDRVAERFDLRHPQAPFFQVADLHNSKNEWKSLKILVPDLGDEGDLFTMRTNWESISAAEAARMVIHCMAYDYAGRKSGPVGDKRNKGDGADAMGVGWAGRLGGTVIEGDNLQETLLLNYVPYRDQAGPADLPQWEQPPMQPGPRLARHNNKPFNDPENQATGQVELLVWPQRRIRLRWEGDAVTGVFVANGDPVGYTTKDRIEMMSPWQLNENKSKVAREPRYMSKKLDPDHAMWRSLGGILPNPKVKTSTSKWANGAEEHRSAGTVRWLGTLIDQGVLQEDLVVRIRMVSMHYGTNDSSFSQIAADSLTLTSPLVTAKDDHARAVVRDAVDRTEETGEALCDFFDDLRFAVSGGSKNSKNKEVKDAAKAAAVPVRRKFYGAIDAQFRSWITRFTPGADYEALLVEWSRLLYETCRRQAQELEAAAGSAIWTGRWNDRGRRVNAATAWRRLEGKLGNTLREIGIKDAGEPKLSLTTKEGNDSDDR